MNVAKTGILDIPMRVIFTDEGVQYFSSQGKKISKFRLSDGVEEYGFHVVDFSPKTIQRMQMLGYLSKIELPLSDIVSKRKSLIDLVKLLTYGMLYRQFDTSLFGHIVESELIQNWNRHNLKNPIDYRTKINSNILNSVLVKNQAVVIEVKKLMKTPIVKAVESSEHLHDNEKQTHIYLAEKFLDNLNPLVYFILAIHRGSTAYYDIIRVAQGLLSEYMDRSSIPEYLALMLVEVLMNIRMSEGGTNLSKLLIDENIYLLYRINRKRPEAGDRGRVHLMISNQKAGFEEMKQKINSRITTTVSGKSLKDFYFSAANAEEGMNLGLYYLSYLSEACRKVKINFESFVNRNESDSTTTIHLILTF
jgi:hypothetical protein